MVDELKKWAVNYNISERAIAGFWKSYSTYMIDSPEEFDEVFGNTKQEDIILDIRYISLNLGNWPECNNNTILACIPIVIETGKEISYKEIGYYKLILNLDGTIQNDIFEIY